MEDLTASGNIRIKNIYKILFICFVVIGSYYPSIFSGFNSIDDPHIISALENTDFNLLDIILPGKSTYYRPVIWLSYFFDKHVWGLEPGFMHLDNILIHACNAVLLYVLAKRIAGTDMQRLELPLLSALLFAVHPINTEAVCWIAGRTDLLATTFILAAACLIAGSPASENPARLYLAAGLIFIGCLAKELAFFFFPVACLVVLLQYHSVLSSRNDPCRFQTLFRRMLPFFLFPIVYLYLRQSALPGADKSVANLLTQKLSLVETVFAAFKAFGFYIKKLFIPLPLNFAIVSYSGGYIWFGLAAVVLICWLFWQRKTYRDILFGAFFLIVPAVIVAVKPIAWTPVAERYLYAPSALFAIAIVGILYGLLTKKQYEYILTSILLAIIMVSAFITVQRNLVWQDNLLLYKDAVAKSPQFAKIRNEYGVALVAAGKSSEANSQFETGKELGGGGNLPVVNLANAKIAEGNSSEGLKILASTYKDKSSAQSDILRRQARVYELLLYNVSNKYEKRKIIAELLDLYHYIYLKDKDPFMSYRSGQLMLLTGEPQKAAVFFELAFNEAPDGVFYKLPAKKLAYNLSRRK